MFTGLIEDIGVVRGREARGPGARLTIATKLGPLTVGESVAVDGACLTVDTIVTGGFDAECSAETLRATTLGRLQAGRRVHLERAVAVGARFGGHFVAGHVDAAGVLVASEALGEARKLTFRLPSRLMRYVVAKGSIALNGVSLTVNEVSGDVLSVVIVPHTRDATVLVGLGVGDEVNVETDMLARFVARYLETSLSPLARAAEDGGLLAALKRSGYSD